MKLLVYLFNFDEFKRDVFNGNNRIIELKGFIINERFTKNVHLIVSLIFSFETSYC